MSSGKYGVMTERDKGLKLKHFTEMGISDLCGDVGKGRRAVDMRADPTNILV